MISLRINHQKALVKIQWSFGKSPGFGFPDCLQYLLLLFHLSNKLLCQKNITRIRIVQIQNLHRLFDK